MNLINKKLLDQKIENFKGFPEGTRFDLCKTIVDNWAKSIANSDLLKMKETSTEQAFLTNFFKDLLGYAQVGSSATYNLYPKYTIGSDLFADAVLGFFASDSKTAKAVIELKGANISLDKKQGEREKGYTPVGQAFEYASKINGCNWIIVSNFKEIRLYSKLKSQDICETFNLAELTNPDIFKRFYYLFCKDNLIGDGTRSVIEEVIEQSAQNDENITKRFYSQYKQIRLAFFGHLQEHNPNLDRHLLLEKTQKFLDRMMFVFFCEDTNGLLPLNISRQTHENGKKSRDRFDEKIWREFKNLFFDINDGRYDVEPPINKYNGGLFKQDDILDNLSIKDSIWEELMKLAAWDYATDLNVNILGHIFEQSISDLETLRAEISGEVVDKSKSKRKKEGVYYTPEYITKYIVENTVGRWLEENPDKLLDIKILDPACGSGAFLNQAHSFLTKQYKLRNDEAMKDASSKSRLFDYHAETEILTKNLFGVDLNEESVEITKLSLWLKTATKNEQLKNLDGNIKCGNSLIDDPAIAGDKAFDWKASFPEIFASLDKGGGTQVPEGSVKTGNNENPPTPLNNGGNEKHSFASLEKGGARRAEGSGFDVVISNPPYIYAREKIGELDKQYYQKEYASSEYQVNTFVLFIEKALKLLNNNGYLGMIVPNSVLMISSISRLREHILKTCAVTEIVSLNGFSFDNVNVETVILVLHKGHSTSNVLTSSIKMEKETQTISADSQHMTDGSNWINNSNFEFNLQKGINDCLLLNRMNISSKKLENMFDVRTSLKAYQVGKGQPKQTRDDVEKRVFDYDTKIDEFTFPYLDGVNVSRYIIYKHAYYLKYGKHLAEPRSIDIFQRPRVLIREITSDFPKCLMAVFTNETYLNNLSIINVLSPDDDIGKLKVLTGILNSKLISYYFMKSTPKAARSMFPKLILQDLRQFPIPDMDEAASKLAPLVDSLQDLNRQKYIFTDTASTYVENQYKTKIKLTAEMGWDSFIEKIEKQKNKLNNSQKEDLLSWFNGKKAKISEFGDELGMLEKRLNDEVYKLYGLTPDEIKIIEQASF